MTIRTIALGLFSAVEADWLVAQAADLSRSLGAHLTAVHPAESLLPYALSEAGFSSVVEPMLLDWQIAETEAIRRRFEAETKGETSSTEFRAQSAGMMGAEAFLLESLRGADLVVFGRSDPGAMRPDDRRLQESAIRDGGRPALMLPKGATFSGKASRLLIGWSGTREATRAAHDALDLVAEGATIHLLRIGRGRVTYPDSRADVAKAMDRLGFRTELVERDAGGNEVGDVLLKVARETGAEMLVTGAFGHSRTYDFVIGAATRHLLTHAHVPLLLSK